MVFNWSLTGGAASRPDSLTGLDQRFAAGFSSLYNAAPAWVQQGLSIHSGYRSDAVQQQLWDQALIKYGSPEAARKWVAPPGSSQHNKGRALDLTFATDAVKKWVHDNAARFGLHFPMAHEPWHIEAIGGRQLAGYEAVGSGSPTQITVSYSDRTGSATGQGDVTGGHSHEPQWFERLFPGRYGPDGNTIGSAGNPDAPIQLGVNPLETAGNWIGEQFGGIALNIVFVILGLVILAAGLYLIVRGETQIKLELPA